MFGRMTTSGTEHELLEKLYVTRHNLIMKEDDVRGKISGGSFHKAEELLKQATDPKQQYKLRVGAAEELTEELLKELIARGKLDRAYKLIANVQSDAPSLKLSAEKVAQYTMQLKLVERSQYQQRPKFNPQPGQ